MPTATPEKVAPMTLKIPVDVRRQALGTLRMDGVTMQAFLTRVLQLVTTHDPRITSVVEELRTEAASVS